MKSSDWPDFCANHPDLVNEIFVNLVKNSVSLQKTEVRSIFKIYLKNLTNFCFKWSTKKVKQEITKPELSSDLKMMFESQKFADFTIVVNEMEIKVHKIILYGRSLYFSSMLSHDCIETSENRMVINDSNYEAIFEMLRFIYYDEVNNLEKVVFDLIIAADRVMSCNLN